MQTEGHSAVADAVAANGAVSLEGDVLRPMSLSIEQLRQRPSVLAEPFDLRCFTTNRFIRAVERYRGALLRDLLAQAGLRCEQPGDFKRMVFIAIGHDDYAVTFSWHELFNTPIGERVLVAYECGGQRLDAEDGAPVLFSGADLLPAPRHVKRLARVIAKVIRF